MNHEFLEKLNQAYSEVRSIYGSEFKITDINTSKNENSTAQSTAAQVADSILDLFPNHS